MRRGGKLILECGAVPHIAAHGKPVLKRNIMCKCEKLPSGGHGHQAVNACQETLASRHTGTPTLSAVEGREARQKSPLPALCCGKAHARTRLFAEDASSLMGGAWPAV